MEQLHDANLTRGDRPPRTGRKNSKGEEKVFNKTEIKKGAGECMKLYLRAQAAMKRYNDAKKAVAERGGIQSATLHKLVVASARHKYEEVKRDVDQEQLVFLEIGEIAGGPKPEGDE